MLVVYLPREAFAQSAPGVTTQPTNRVALLGSATVFSAAGTGTEPLFYQWQKNGTNLLDGGRVSGALSSSLMISNIQMSDLGGYNLVLSNSSGTAVSAEASLLVVPVVAWGVSSYGETNVPFASTNATAIAAGIYHSLALKSDGKVIQWGNSNFVAPPVGLSNVVAIAAGYGNNLALRKDGKVVGWGLNAHGEATPPVGLSNVVAIAEGNNHSLALRNDGTVAAWGSNQFNQTNVPSDLSNVVAISAGDSHSLALRSDGNIVAWGDNDAGQTNVPAGLSKVVAIAGGGASFSLALKSDGTVVGWGNGLYGATTTPAGLSNVVAIAAGTFHSLALRRDSVIISWGFDSPPDGLTNVAAISGGYVHSLALVENPAVQVPPLIWWQQSDRTVSGGQTTIFEPYVIGSRPLTFQWYFNGTILAGQTNEWLMLDSIQTNQFGSYYFIVTNNYGSATGQVAVLSEGVPGIVTQPASRGMFIGSDVNFSTTVVGTGPLGYQWYFNGTPLGDSAHIAGSTTASLIISNAQASDAGSYSMVITNAIGSNATIAATLAMVSQPTNQNVLAGTTASFTVSVTGSTSLSYRWYFNGVALTNSARISGTTNLTLTLSNIQTNDNGAYQLVITNVYGAATSAVATLTAVAIPAVITSQPTNRTALRGDTVAFAATAIGTAPMAYRWYFNGTALTNGSHGGRITGATNSTLTITGSQTNDSGDYQIVVTNYYQTDTSVVATLTVLVPVAITTQPHSQAILLGSSATLMVAANGTEPLNYQWYFCGSPLSDNGRITGSRTPILQLANVQASDAGDYVAVVTNYFSTAASIAASLTPQAILSPSVRYVNVNNPNPSSPYLDWSTAATNIQDAIDAAVDGDLVLVTNGIYSAEKRVVSGSVANRAALTKAVTLLSVNGPQATTIIGETQTRGVYVADNAALSGFTVTGGHADSGGGVWCEPGGVVSNCIVQGNFASSYGGGVYGGTVWNSTLTTNLGYDGGGAAVAVLYHSILASNTADFGGGAYVCLLSNCTVTANYGYYNGGVYGSTNYNCLIKANSNSYKDAGGAYSSKLYNCVLMGNTCGAYSCTLYNCTVVSNTVTSGVGGMRYCTAYNSIIYFNSGSTSSNWYQGTLANCCTRPLPNGSGNFTNAPLFADQAGGDFHLQTISPCINSGENAYAVRANDFDGNPRIVGGTVDIGAYEFQTPASVLSYAWAQQFGLPTDGSADFVDSDGDGMNNWQEWIAGTNPTNATSVLIMSSPVTSKSPKGVKVIWQSVTGKTYFLQRSTNLSLPLGFSTIQSNLTGLVGTTSFTDTTATNGNSFFYRVGVQ